MEGEKSGIRLNMLLIIGVGLIVLLAVGIISLVNFNAANEVITIKSTDTLNALSFGRAEHIADILVSTSDQIKGLAELDLFQNNLLVVTEESVEAMQEALEDINDKTNSFYEIQVVDINGIIIASSSDISSEVDEDVGENIATEKYFIEGLEESFISDAHFQHGIPSFAR